MKETPDRGEEKRNKEKRNRRHLIKLLIDAVVLYLEVYATQMFTII